MVNAAQSLCRSLIDDPKNMVAESLFDQFGIKRAVGEIVVSELCREGVLRRHGDCLKVADRALAEGVIAGESPGELAPSSFENYVDDRTAAPLAFRAAKLPEDELGGPLSAPERAIAPKVDKRTARLQKNQRLKAAEAEQASKSNGNDVPRFTERSAAHRASKGKLNGATSGDRHVCVECGGPRSVHSINVGQCRVCYERHKTAADAPQGVRENRTTEIRHEPNVAQVPDHAYRTNDEPSPELIAAQKERMAEQEADNPDGRETDAEFIARAAAYQAELKAALKGHGAHGAVQRLPEVTEQPPRAAAPASAPDPLIVANLGEYLVLRKSDVLDLLGAVEIVGRWRQILEAAR